jgi:hypothetical protein
MLWLYETESANKSQIDVNHKTCDIRTWTKHLFLDISSTNICTLVPPLYQRIETRCIVVCRPSWFRNWSAIICDFPAFLRKCLYPLVNWFTGQTLPALNRKHFFINTLCIKSLCLQKSTTERCSMVVKSWSTVAILTTETSPWICTSASGV